MKRVMGIGGVFFKAEKPDELREWYARHLGFHTDQYGTNFEWRHTDQPDRKGFTQWTTFSRRVRILPRREKTSCLIFGLRTWWIYSTP